MYQDWYITHIPGATAAKIAWLGGLQICIQFAFGLFSGKALDEGHWRITTLIGSVLLVGGYLAVSVCTQYWQLVLAQGNLPPPRPR